MQNTSSKKRTFPQTQFQTKIPALVPHNLNVSSFASSLGSLLKAFLEGKGESLPGQQYNRIKFKRQQVHLVDPNLLLFSLGVTEKRLILPFRFYLVSSGWLKPYKATKFLRLLFMLSLMIFAFEIYVGASNFRMSVNRLSFSHRPAAMATLFHKTFYMASTFAA